MEEMKPNQLPLPEREFVIRRLRMEKRFRRKRKQYLIAKKFQLKYVGLILLLMFLTAALCSYVVYYTSMLLLGEKLANVYPQGRLISMVKIVNLKILLSLILISPLVAVIGVFLSHGIAGPIYRMEKFMADVASGNLTARITLRRKDELVTLADGINYLVDSLRDAVMTEKTHLNKVAAQLTNLKKALETKPIDQSLVSEALNRVSSAEKDLNKAFDRYKL